MPIDPSTARIEALLKKDGPCLSTDLCRTLEQAGVLPVNARKQVSRARGSIRRLTTLQFPKKASFLFLESQRNTTVYWNALLKAAIQHSPTYGPAIAALIVRGKVMPRSHFLIACGAPVLQKGQISAETLLSRLRESEIIKEEEIIGIGKCVVLSANEGSIDIKINSLRSRLIVERILSDAIKTWAGRLGLASHDAIRGRDDSGANEPPKVGTCYWDITGPSYLQPLVRWDKNSKHPGFFVCDLVAGHEIDKPAISAFIKKCSLVASLKKVSRFLPFLIADRFSKEAFQLGRKNGIVVATPEMLFGKEIAQALQDLLSALSNTAKALETPGRLNELFNKLSQIEGAAGNLRGALFELIVAHCVQLIEGGGITLNKVVTDLSSGAKAEIDVQIEKHHQSLTLIECKGQQPSSVVSETSIQLWLNSKIPTINNALKTNPQYSQYKFAFEYWTCGTFSEAALLLLKDAAEKTKAYEIRFKDRDAIKTYVSQLKGAPILNTLNEHYFKHPLTKLIKS